MRGQSYLGRIAGAALASGPRLSVPPAATGEPPGTPSLSLLLWHLSDPSVSPQPPAEASAWEWAPAEAAPGEPAFPAPRPGPQQARFVLPLGGPAPPAISTTHDPAPVRPPAHVAFPGDRDAAAEAPPPLSPRRALPDERSMTVGPASDAAAAPAITRTPPGSQSTPPPVAVPAAQSHKDAASPQQSAAQAAPVHVHIGTVEVRATAPAPKITPPAATPSPPPAAGAAPMPPRGYGSRFGLLQR